MKGIPPSPAHPLGQDVQSESDDKGPLPTTERGFGPAQLKPWARLRLTVDFPSSDSALVTNRLFSFLASDCSRIRIRKNLNRSAAIPRGSV